MSQINELVELYHQKLIDSKKTQIHDVKARIAPIQEFSDWLESHGVVDFHELDRGHIVAFRLNQPLDMCAY